MRTSSIDADGKFAFGPRAVSSRRVAYVLAIHLGAACAVLPGTFSVWAVLAAVALHFATGCLGVSIGLHRSLAHKSVAFPLWLQRTFVFLAVLDAQKPITWVAVHRLHHRYPGTDLDAHNANRGFAWSHLGWLLRDRPFAFEPNRWARDVARDPFYMFLENNFFVIFLSSLVVLYMVGGLPWLIWAGFVRLVVVAHSTWAINSFCHSSKFGGYQNHPAADGFNSRFWARLTYGEGLHNNHHHNRRVANFAVRCDEMDLSWYVIRALSGLHLARARKEHGDRDGERHCKPRYSTAGW